MWSYDQFNNRAKAGGDVIDISNVDFHKFVKEVYELSQPQGMGHMHFKPGPLSDEQAAQIVGQLEKYGSISMDYVNGRACKMHVFMRDGKWQIADKWYDHSEADLEMLLSRCGITAGQSSCAG